MGLFFFAGRHRVPRMDRDPRVVGVGRPQERGADQHGVPCQQPEVEPALPGPRPEAVPVGIPTHLVGAQPEDGAEQGEVAEVRGGLQEEQFGDLSGVQNLSAMKE